jgi:hypothetical protein
MYRSQEPDQLTIDAQAALDAGMSYGQWMAQKPPRSPVTPTESPALSMESDPENIRYCKICGAPFNPVVTRRIKFCSDACCKVQHRNYIRQYRAANSPDKTKEGSQ